MTRDVSNGVHEEGIFCEWTEDVPTCLLQRCRRYMVLQAKQGCRQRGLGWWVVMKASHIVDNWRWHSYDCLTQPRCQQLPGNARDTLLLPHLLAVTSSYCFTIILFLPCLPNYWFIYSTFIHKLLSGQGTIIFVISITGPFFWQGPLVLDQELGAFGIAFQLKYSRGEAVIAGVGFEKIWVKKLILHWKCLKKVK